MNREKRKYCEVCFSHCSSSAFTHQACKGCGKQDTHGRNCTSVKKTEARPVMNTEVKSQSHSCKKFHCSTRSHILFTAHCETTLPYTQDIYRPYRLHVFMLILYVRCIEVHSYQCDDVSFTKSKLSQMINLTMT